MYKKTRSKHASLIVVLVYIFVEKFSHLLPGASINDVQAMVENHLKQMILKTFDPKKADTIFTEEGDVSVRCGGKTERCG